MAPLADLCLPVAVVFTFHNAKVFHMSCLWDAKCSLSLFCYALPATPSSDFILSRKGSLILNPVPSPHALLTPFISLPYKYMSIYPPKLRPLGGGGCLLVHESPESSMTRSQRGLINWTTHREHWSHRSWAKLCISLPLPGELYVDALKLSISKCDCIWR